MRETKDRNQSRRRGKNFLAHFAASERDVLFGASTDGQTDRWTDVTHLLSRTCMPGKFLVCARLGDARREKATTMAEE